MPSTKVIKSRIRSVKNIGQITKAMEVVSATKMRRSQESALRARPYALASLAMLKNLLMRTPVLPPLLRERPVERSLLIVMVSDKGLAGAFNANVLRKAESWIQEKKAKNAPHTVAVVGKKAREHLSRRGIPIERFFSGFGDYSQPEETLPLADFAIQGFLDGAWDEVSCAYTRFRTTLVQESVLEKILPATVEGIERIVQGILPERGRFATAPTTNHQPPTAHYFYEYTFEPSAEEVLESLARLLIRMHLHHIALESGASEHSARMVAMKNASDNARDLVRGLTREYNKARQTGITRELVEITAGREALE